MTLYCWRDPSVWKRRDHALEDAKDDRRVKGRVALAHAVRTFSAGRLDEARDHATDAAVLFEDDGDRRSAGQRTPG